MVQQLAKIITTAVLVTHFSIVEASETTSNTPTISPFSAKYSVLHKSKPVGEGVRKLELMADGKAKYSYRTEIEWLIFDDIREETSILDWQNNSVVPLEYTYVREGTGKDKFYQWTYDVANGKATNKKEDTTIHVEYPTQIQDKLSYHFKHRLNMIANPKQEKYTYPVIGTSGSIKDYEYQYDGEEEIMLPYGIVKTIRLKREIAEKKRVTYAWFAPELNYLMVKLYQKKGDVEQFEAQLKEYTLLDTPKR